VNSDFTFSSDHAGKLAAEQGRRHRMRSVATIVIGLASCVLGAALTRADHAPVYVIPGRPGTPVVINGYDASYSVVEGDWGLWRPGHVPPTIVTGPLIAPAPFHSGAYFPSLGRRPGYGRREIEPPPDRPLPRPAPGYYREWGAQSDLRPADLDPPPNPPPVIVAPQVELHGGRRSKNRR
jgi:hypothetical protein